MPKVTVSKPFVWRAGHQAVLIEKGEQELTDDQHKHAKHHGYLQTTTKQLAKKESAQEQNHE